MPVGIILELPILPMVAAFVVTGMAYEFGITLNALVELETIVPLPCGGFCPPSWVVVLTILLVCFLLGIGWLLSVILPLLRFI